MGCIKKNTEICNQYFSEFGFMKYRLKIEIEYLLFIIKLLKINISSININEISNIINNFNPKECLIIKDYEKKCNHDVKSIEYYIRNNSKINKENYIEIINKLELNTEEKNLLFNLTHKNYIGNALSI